MLLAASLMGSLGRRRGRDQPTESTGAGTPGHTRLHPRPRARNLDVLIRFSNVI